MRRGAGGPGLIRAAGTTIATNQFSVTTHRRLIYPSRGESGLPGLFVMFELAPILVSLSEVQRSFAHFLTSVCAIVGGIFTVAGMVAAVLHRMQKAGKGD